MAKPVVEAKYADYVALVPALDLARQLAEIIPAAVSAYLGHPVSDAPSLVATALVFAAGETLHAAGKGVGADVIAAHLATSLVGITEDGITPKVCHAPGSSRRDN